MIVTTDNFIFLLSKLAGEHVIHQRGRSSTIACIYVIASDRVFHCVQVEISKGTRLGFTTRAPTWASSHVSRSLYYPPTPFFRYTQCFDSNIDHVATPDYSMYTGSGAFTGFRCYLSQRLSSQDDRCKGVQEGHEAKCKSVPYHDQI